MSNLGESSATAENFDEPDFEKHIGDVLDDYRDGLVDRDEAVAAIMEHPGRMGDLVEIGPLER